MFPFFPRQSSFPHFPTDFSRVPAPFNIPTTSTTTTTVRPTTKPSTTSTTPKTIKTKATTKTPTTIADHLIGGFLPVLINSKGTPPSSSPVELSPVSDTGASLNGTTKFEAIHFSSSNKPIKTTIHASDLNLEDKQPSKPSAYSKSKVEYFGYKPTSDQDEWEDGDDSSGADGGNDKNDQSSSISINSSTKEKEESAITVIDTSIPSTQVIHKIVNDSNGVRLENIYPIVDNNSKKSISSSSSSSSKSITSTNKPSEADIVGKASKSVPINSNVSLKNTTNTSHEDQQPHIETKFAANGTISVHSSSHSSSDHDPIPEGIEDEGDENIAPLIPNDFTPANGTDDAILSHIMSLISDNSTPPEVKIVSRSDGNTVQSTHVEIHHNLRKRSANAFVERRMAPLEVDSVYQIPSKEKLAMNSAISRSFQASFSVLCWNLLTISLTRYLLSLFS